MDKTCSNCKHWCYAGGEEGRCRRYPPVILHNLINKGCMFESELLYLCTQPVSVDTDMCGEWCYDFEGHNGYPFDSSPFDRTM
jgi:hypothetical protein